MSVIALAPDLQSGPVARSVIPRSSDITTMPKLLSPRFFAVLSTQSDPELKCNKLRIHFQHLMANEFMGDYDYFAVIAGPVSPGDRYCNTESSRGFEKFRMNK